MSEMSAPAFDERQARDVPPIEVQKIESVIDEMHAALAVRRRLRMGESSAIRRRRARRVSPMACMGMDYLSPDKTK